MEEEFYSREELILRDHLALDRTRLANERTLLSYLRTALMLMVAGAIELITGVLVTIGLFTRLAAFVASGEMAVAYFIGHFPKSF